MDALNKFSSKLMTLSPREGLCAIAFSGFYVFLQSFYTNLLGIPFKLFNLLTDWRVNHFFWPKQEWITFTCKGSNIRGRSLNMLNKVSNNWPSTYPWLTLVKESFYNGMVFCYQNCSDLLWEKVGLVIEKNFEITRTIYSNSGRSGQSLVQSCA